MANKKISELTTRTPSLSDLMLVGDPSSGYSFKCTVTALATIIETDIADGYVTLGTAQTISGAKTFSNNLTLTSVSNAGVDTDKFLVLSASNVVNFRTGAEVLSDIGAQAALTNPITGTGTSGQVSYFNGTNSITSSPTFAFTPTSQLLVNNSVTAASAIARGINATPSLTAAANNDVLVGLDINPTFTNGAFTGVNNYGIRYNSSNAITPFFFQSTVNGTAYTYNTLGGNNDFFINSRDVLTSRFRVQNGGANGVLIRSFNNTTDITNEGTNNRIILYNSNYFYSTGNVGINQNTDAGFRLDVNGTARVQGATTITGNVSVVTNAGTSQVTIGDGSTSPNGTLRIAKSATSNAANIFFRNVSTDVARIWLDNSDNLTLTNGSNLIVGTTGLQVSGSITAASAIARGINVNNTLVAAANNDVLVGLDINPTFTNGAFTGVSNFGIRTTSAISGGSFIPTSSTIPTNGMYLPAANRISLARNGVENIRFDEGTMSFMTSTTSVIYFANQIGSRIQSDGYDVLIAPRQTTKSVIVGLGWGNLDQRIAFTPSTSSNWNVGFIANTGTNPTVNFTLGNGPSNVMSFFTNQNVFIGSSPTDAGFRLDVNGTARVQSNMTIGASVSGTSYSLIFASSLPAAGTRAIIDFGNNAGIVNRRKNNGGNDHTLSFIISGGGAGTELLTIQSSNSTVTTNNVGINNTNPDITAILDIASTTKGFLRPRMTTAQRDVISTPATGLSVYNTSTNTNDYYNGSAWLNVGQVLVPANNTTGFSISGSSLTGSNAQSLVSLSQTWNTTGNPTAFLLNITNTASGATADLMELQVGGVAQFIVGKSGTIQTTAPAGGTAAAWKLGTVASVSPTSPNRTIEVEVGGTTYYLHAKTTND